MGKYLECYYRELRLESVAGSSLLLARRCRFGNRVVRRASVHGRQSNRITSSGLRQVQGQVLDPIAETKMDEFVPKIDDRNRSRPTIALETVEWYRKGPTNCRKY